MIRLSVIYRGRAVSLDWKVIEHGSSAVSFETYRDWLEEAKRHLPFACQVVFLADRGFTDTQLMAHLRELGWHFRIRIKSNFWIYPTYLAPFQVGDIDLAPGYMRCCQGVQITDHGFSPVHLAIARPLGSHEY